MDIILSLIKVPAKITDEQKRRTDRFSEPAPIGKTLYPVDHQWDRETGPEVWGKIHSSKSIWRSPVRDLKVPEHLLPFPCFSISDTLSSRPDDASLFGIDGNGKRVPECRM